MTDTISLHIKNTVLKFGVVVCLPPFIKSSDDIYRVEYKIKHTWYNIPFTYQFSML